MQGQGEVLLLPFCLYCLVLYALFVLTIGAHIGQCAYLPWHMGCYSLWLQIVLPLSSRNLISYGQTCCNLPQRASGSFSFTTFCFVCLIGTIVRIWWSCHQGNSTCLQGENIKWPALNLKWMYCSFPFHNFPLKFLFLILTTISKKYRMAQRESGICLESAVWSDIYS